MPDRFALTRVKLIHPAWRMLSKAEGLVMVAVRVCPSRAACDARALLWVSLVVLIVLLALPSCGGGGGGDGAGVIPPFWTRGAITVVDLDGDGRDDVVVASTYVAGGPPHPGTVEVYLQTVVGAFAAPASYAVGADPWELSAGDLDGDGALDLVVASPATVAPQPGVTGDSGGIALLRQNVTQRGRFLGTQWYPTGGIAQGVAIAELTGDGRADVVVADGALVNGRMLLLAHSATVPGSLLAPVAVPVGNGLGSAGMAVRDLDGDGRADVVLASSVVAVMRQRAGGGFDPAQLLSAGLRPQGVALGDVDGDGRMDIVVANAGNAPAGGVGGASVTVLRQTTAGAFSATQIPVADGARRVAIGDLNGDGLPDIAVVSLVYHALFTPSRVTVLLQSAAQRGTFVVGAVFDGPLVGDFIALGDANGDGRTDIFFNDGPAVAVQRASAPGTFEPLRPLR